MASNVVQQDPQKTHFDDVYVQTSPVKYKERFFDDTEYICDTFNCQVFDRLILEWAQNKAESSGPIRYVDMGSCFGNTSLAILHGMSFEEIRENWTSEESCTTISKPRRF